MAKIELNHATMNGSHLLNKLDYKKLLNRPKASVAFKYSATVPDDHIMDIVDVSEEKDGSVLMWFDGLNIYLYSEAPIIRVSNAEDMFCILLSEQQINEFYGKIRFVPSFIDVKDCASGMWDNENGIPTGPYSDVLSSIDLDRFDFSRCKNMSSMFYGCGKLTSINLSKFDTSNVVNMNSMFGRCGSLTCLDVSSLDTQRVTEMSGMFNIMQQLNVSRCVIIQYEECHRHEQYV